MARIGGGTVKLTEADLWHRYRHPASIDALIPIECVLEALRDEDANLPDPNARALRLSKRIESELKGRGGFAGLDLFYVFENDLYDIDNMFYKDRFAQFKDQDLNFARNTYVDRLMIPFNIIVSLFEEERLLPYELSAKYRDLQQDNHSPGHDRLDSTAETNDVIRPELGHQSDKRRLTEEELKTHFENIDCTQSFVINGISQKINSRNIDMYLSSIGFYYPKVPAHRIFSSVAKRRPGRPLKTS